MGRIIVSLLLVFSIVGGTFTSLAKENDTKLDEQGESLNEKIVKPYSLHENKVNQAFTHTVKNDDTIQSIGDKYKVNTEDIQVTNALISERVVEGQKLYIYKINPVKVEDKKEVLDKEQEDKDKKEHKTLTVVATAYTAECDGCSGITATGINLNKDRNKKVIAVDPNVIPLGSKVYVEGYGEAIAGDIGGAIKGNKIDIHVPTKKEAFKWGVREVEVTILG